MLNISRQILFCYLSNLMFLVVSSTACAQTKEGKLSVDEEQALVEKWYKAYDEIIDSIQVSQTPPTINSATNSAQAELKREIILSISNPAFLGRHGRVYLWTENGRPVVLSAIMSSLDANGSGRRHVTYEFNSLSQNPVTAGRNDRVYWNCTEPGVKWQSELEESRPSSNRTARLAQMRTIARDIEANIGANNFRLMTTPLYRYPIETPDLTDGAIFAFVNGTDPVIFLLIEARQDKWYLSCSPSNVGKISAKKGTKIIELFDYGRNGDIFQTRPWYQRYTAELRPGNDPNKILSQAWGNR